MPQKSRPLRHALLAAAGASLFFAAPASAAKTYFALTYGFASVPVEEAEMSKKSGYAFGASIGKRLGKNFALEGTGRYLSFGPQTTDQAGISTTSSQTKYFLGGGARAFLGKYLSAHAGLGAGQIQLNITNSVTSKAETPGRFVVVLYYGAGLQIPLGETVELTADYAGVGLGMSATEYQLGLRLKFE